MGYIENKTCYLSGPLSFDIPEDWRTPVKKVLTEGLKLNVFDPSLDPKQKQVSLIQQLKQEKKFDEVSKIVHSFLRADLSIVDHSDFLIAHLPWKVPVFGTVHEIINSNNAKKPTLLVCTQGKEKMSTWAYGFVKHEFMFGSWDELYQYLYDVDAGKHKDNNRWWFAYNYYQKDGKFYSRSL